MNLLEALQCVRGNFIISVGPNRDDILHAKFEDPEEQNHFDIKLDPGNIESLYIWTVVKMEANTNGCDDLWTEITIAPWYPTDRWTDTFGDMKKDKFITRQISTNPEFKIIIDRKYDFTFDQLEKLENPNGFDSYLYSYYDKKAIYIFSSKEEMAKALSEDHIAGIKRCRKIDGKYCSEREDEE